MRGILVQMTVLFYKQLQAHQTRIKPAANNWMHKIQRGTHVYLTLVP